MNVRNEIQDRAKAEIFYLYFMLSASEINHKLLQVKPVLFKKYGLNRMALFGSYARSEERPDSDIDIAVDFEKPVGIEFIDLALELEKLLGKKVDLISINGIKEKYFQSIQQDLKYV